MTVAHLKDSRLRRILVVDDDADNLRMITSLLQHEGYQAVPYGSGSEFLATLGQRAEPDLVLLDINMPGVDGLEILRRIRQREPYVSVIFVSARSEKEDIIRGLDTGADDYLVKPFDPRELLARVRAQLRIKDLHDRLTAANRKLEELVDVDDLTGLFNMRSVYQKIENEIHRAGRFERAVGVVMMDLDEFKKVNDTHDHLFGSFVLSQVGRIIRHNIRQVDFAARYGGDEFLITLSETTVDGAFGFCERLRKTIAATLFQNKTDSMHLTASLGLAVVEPARSHIDSRTLVRAADSALYDAKRGGKNCTKVYDINQFNEPAKPRVRR
jgi:diguanylate cyclase (GGDEF)-like protein